MILAAALLASGVYAVEPVRHSDPNMPGLPEQTDEYWAKLREEQRAAKQAAQQQEAVSEEGTFFYTGKPYDADLGYVFKYRNYSPEIMRWTTADPSGFPDGPNNYGYASKPISQIDSLGLSIYPSDIMNGELINNSSYTVNFTADGYKYYGILSDGSKEYFTSVFSREASYNTEQTLTLLVQYQGWAVETTKMVAFSLEPGKSSKELGVQDADFITGATGNISLTSNGVPIVFSYKIGAHKITVHNAE